MFIQATPKDITKGAVIWFRNEAEVIKPVVVEQVIDEECEYIAFKAFNGYKYGLGGCYVEVDGGVNVKEEMRKLYTAICFIDREVCEDKNSKMKGEVIIKQLDALDLIHKMYNLGKK